MNLALYALGLAALLANQRVNGRSLAKFAWERSTPAPPAPTPAPAGQWADDWVYNSVVNKATGKGCTGYPLAQHQQCPNGYFACGDVWLDAAGCPWLEPADGERGFGVPQGTLKCCLTDDSGAAARAHSFFHVLARGLTRVLVSRATQTAAATAGGLGGGGGFKLDKTRLQAGLVAGLAPPPSPAPRPSPAPPPAPIPPSDAFKVIFVSDLERGYRGHTDQDVEDVMDEIIAQKPALVIHGGDNYDDEHSANKGKRYYQKLLDSGIPFITTNGNHDGQNDGAEVFVKNSYLRTEKLADSSGKFTFKFEQPAGAHGYKAEFNGLQIASFLWKGKEVVNAKGDRGGEYDYLTQAEAAAMEAELDTSKPTLIVNHQPGVNAVDALVQKLPLGSAVFCGHTHKSAIRPIAGGFQEHTAPYPHQWQDLGWGVANHGDTKENPDQTLRERGMLSVIVSPTKGVFSVTQIDTKLKSRTWSDGTRCSSTLGTPSYNTCHKCKNGWDWWNSKAVVGHHCGPALEYGRETGVPMKDQTCPQHYKDTGLFCTRCHWSGWKLKCDTRSSLGCDSGLEQVGLLCYKPCRAGYRGAGFMSTWCSKNYLLL